MGAFDKIKKIQNVLILKLKQRKYKKITYYFEKGNSDVLFVGFSGFPGKIQKPLYNYVRTLKPVNANKLFILDNYGYNGCGSYYLGENGDWFMPEQIKELICETQEKYGIKKTVMFGSSKGGTSALYYGMMCSADVVIAAAPQYYIGDYLNTDSHRSILESIIGSSAKKTKDDLNLLLPDAIHNCKSKPHIIIHYSPCEHTYNEHIKPLTDDLKSNNFDVTEDNEYTYTEHNDVAKFFPNYLLKCCEEFSVIKETE